MSEAAEITRWLDSARGGDRGALDRVLAALYRELHALARRQLDGRRDQTLNATALVHESYLRLLGAQGAAGFADRAHFFAYAAAAMRSVAVDYARSRMAQKRGGEFARSDLLPDAIADHLRLDENTLALDIALDKLAAAEPALARLVELRYFAGFAEQDIAELTGRSERSVRRDWQKARLFLLAAIEGH